jgi:cytoskeletal protein RodZ
MKKIAFVILLLNQVAFLHAQSTGTSNQTVSLTLKNAISLNITAATGTTLNFDGADDYLNGISNASASTFQVKSNRPWAVTVKAGAVSFTGPAAPAAVMPASVLSVRLTGGTTYTTLSTTAAALTSGTRGDSNFSVDYRGVPGFAYDAGTYTLSVVYTATQQ